MSEREKIRCVCFGLVFGDVIGMNAYPIIQYLGACLPAIFLAIMYINDMRKAQGEP